MNLPATVYVSVQSPGIGGLIRQRPEDFLVEEIPLYHPSGVGEHIYLLVHKRDTTTTEAARIIAKHFGVRPDAVGFAGQKDARAVTVQTFSVHTPGRNPEDFPLLQHDRVRVLGATLHANKLRLGHLRGNRFSIRIRNVKPTDAVAAHRTVEFLRRAGLPNRFGEQRFGNAGNNHLLGAAIAAGNLPRALEELRRAGETIPDTTTPERAVRRIRKDMLRMYLSAWQSAIFNTVLDQRIAAGTLGSLLPGDLAIKAENSAVFAVDDPTAASEQTRQRLARFEIAPSGPMWGPDMPKATGDIAAVEAQALAQTGVTMESLRDACARLGVRVEGERRAMRVPVIDPEVEGGLDEHGPYIRVAFELPKGSYATALLAEVMKPQAQRG